MFTHVKCPAEYIWQGRLKKAIGYCPLFIFYLVFLLINYLIDSH